MKRIAAVAFLAVTLSGSAGAQNAAAPYDSLALARRYAEWFFTSQKDSLWAHTSPDMQKEMQKPEYWLEGLEQLSSHAGSEEKVIEEKFVKRLGKTQYWRTSKYSLMDEPVMIRFVILPDRTIGGVGMNPQSQAPAIDPIK